MIGLKTINTLEIFQVFTVLPSHCKMTDNQHVTNVGQTKNLDSTSLCMAQWIECLLNIQGVIHVAPNPVRKSRFLSFSHDHDMLIII